jgi:hypothetical protein
VAQFSEFELSAHRLRQTSIVMAFALTFFGCATGPQHGAVQFYPANQEANAFGVLNGEYITNGPGNGTITINMPDGEILTGQYSIVQSGAMGFGSIYASVNNNAGGSASGFGMSRNTALETASPGMASLFGNKGTSMQCEFYNDNRTHHGYGGCRTTKGALFRLQF